MVAVAAVLLQPKLGLSKALSRYVDPQRLLLRARVMECGTSEDKEDDALLLASAFPQRCAVSLELEARDVRILLA